MYIIIGQGAAGSSAARTLRRLKPDVPITVITQEMDNFYSRIDLPDVIKGKRSSEDATLMTADSFADLNIACRMGEKVARVLPNERAVELESGERLTYTKLLLATGSRPILPPIPGIDAKGVFTLWTLADARAIVEASASAKHAVVAGAGLIGLKTALALKARGLNVTIVERLPGIMPRQLDTHGATMIAERLKAEGVAVFTGTSATEVLTKNGVICAVKTDKGELPCDLLVSAVGVRANVDLAREAGLEVGLAITVNNKQQTTDPHIYAAGDASEARDCLSGACVVPAIWPVAVEQGRIAAYNMVNRPVEGNHCLAMNSVEVAGLPLVSFGEINAGPDDEELVSRAPGVYRKLVRRGDRLCGVLFLGDIRQAGVLGNMVQRETPIQGKNLLGPQFTAAALIPETPCF